MAINAKSIGAINIHTGYFINQNNNQKFALKIALRINSRS